MINSNDPLGKRNGLVLEDNVYIYIYVCVCVNYVIIMNILTVYTRLHTFCIFYSCMRIGFVLWCQVEMLHKLPPKGHENKHVNWK